MGHAPPKLLGHHEDRWRSEVGQRAADGDVDEERAQGRVHEARGHAAIVEALLEDERGDRHRGGLRDEAAQQRPDDERGGVEAGASRQEEEDPREALDEAAGELEDGARGRHGHDGEDEGRLGEVEVVLLVVALEELRHPVRAQHEADPDEQDRGPDAEDRLHLAQQVKEVLADRSLGEAVGEVLKALDRERMEDREAEQDRGEDLDGSGVHIVLLEEEGPLTSVYRCVILTQEPEVDGVEPVYEKHIDTICFW